MALLLGIMLFAEAGVVRAQGSHSITATVTVSQNNLGTEAEGLFQKGGELYREGSEESLRRAIEVWKQARELFQDAGNQAREATTLTNIGAVYSALGENQHALDYLNQALPLVRAVGNRGGEATTLNNIAYVYRDQGKLDVALENIDAAIQHH